MFQKKFRYMTALLAALMITQGSFTAFADETPVGPGYEDQNKASTDTTTSDPASAWKKVNGVYVDANGKNMDGALLRGISVSKWRPRMCSSRPGLSMRQKRQQNILWKRCPDMR